jgi:hypothetical protein
MTEFLDVLETQLHDAARRRYAPRRAPRRLFGEIAVAAVALGAVAAVIVVLGGRGDTHSAKTPSAPAPAVGKSVVGLRISVLNATTTPGVARAAADRLAAAGAHIVLVTDDRRHDLDFTQVIYRAGHAADGLAVSRFIGGMTPRDAGLRVIGPLASNSEADRLDADVVLRLGRADHYGDIQLRADQSALSFVSNCRPGFRRLSEWDAVQAGYAVLHHWPEADGAVLRGPPNRTNDCGERATVIVSLELTATGKTVHAFVSCVGDHWVVWRRL